MSDYTPDGISESEPSMEDILASIRKIIADDSSKPQAPATATETASLASPDEAISDFDNVLDLSDDRFAEFVSEDTAPVENIDSSDDNADDDVLDLTESLLVEDEDLSFDGETDFLDIPAEAEQVVDPAADMIAADDNDGIDALVSDLLSEGDEEPDLTPDIIDNAVAVAGTAAPSGELATSGDADIDLVKSLMAELTDDDDAFDELSSGESDAIVAADDDFEFEDLLDTPDEDGSPSDMTGIAAAAVDSELPHDDIDDDLASIVAQS